ncbi:pyocin knob domain-containing protein [Pseudomonas sp. WHRI 8822A]|uniref:pyocin knob domain-containing protein n=1 Tax=Pseudomonas sp. WHRI 8822A TaxID=3162568 RepID=UPI0032EB4D8B
MTLVARVIALAQAVAADVKGIQVSLSGLGTAARKDVTVSSVDLTADRVLRTGDGGWMGDLPVGVNNIDDRTLRGWRYVVETSAGTKPPNAVYGQLLTLGNTNDSVFQEYWELTGASRTHRRYYRQCFGSGLWGEWQPLMSTVERQRFPFPNIMPDGGRFAGKVDLTSLGLSSDFFPGNYFPPYNGATITSAGKFIHSNTTDTQLTEPVQTLLTAMGRLGDDRRYGVEFYIAAVTAGQGATVPNKGADGATRYLLMAMQRAISSAGNYATFVSWVRVRSGSAHLISECYIDGVFYAAGKVIPSGWRHLRIVAPSGYGYFSQMPNVYAVPGSVIEFALPGYFSGEVDVGRHVIPLLGFNGVAS